MTSVSLWRYESILRRRVSLSKHTAYNIAGALLPLSATILTMPPFLRLVGEARYGVLAILWTLLGYFGLFDMGIGRAVSNKIAMMRTAHPSEREGVFWTALSLNFALGLAGALILWTVSYVILSRSPAMLGDLSGEVGATMPWMVAAFPLLLIGGVLTGALSGREQFLVLNVVSALSAVLAQVVPLVVAVSLGPSLQNLVCSIITVRVLAIVALFIACRTQLPARSRPRLVRSHVRPLFNYGGWITVSGVVAPMLTTLDRAIIGGVLGARAVTYYSVPYNLAARITVLPGALSSALFPRFSGQTQRDASLLLFNSTRLLVVLMVAPIVVGLWLMEPFLTWWMGATFSSKATLTGQWIVIGFWANVFAYPAYSCIPARGRPDLIAKLQLAEVAPYLLLLWFALQHFGVAGAAAVLALRNTVDAFILLLLAQVHVRIWRIVFQSFALLCIGITTVVATTPLSAVSWFGLLLTCLLIFLWAWRVEPHVKQFVLRRSGAIGIEGSLGQ
jgi:O-antigen/teichoic acid export membrane protein